MIYKGEFDVKQINALIEEEMAKDPEYVIDDVAEGTLINSLMFYSETLGGMVIAAEHAITSPLTGKGSWGSNYRVYVAEENGNEIDKEFDALWDKLAEYDRTQEQIEDIISNARKQLENNTSAWIELDNGRSIEITYEEDVTAASEGDPLAINDHYFNVRLYEAKGETVNSAKAAALLDANSESASSISDVELLHAPMEEVLQYNKENPVLDNAVRKKEKNGIEH